MGTYHIDEAIRLIKTHVFTTESVSLNPEENTYTVNIIVDYFTIMIKNIKNEIHSNKQENVAINKPNDTKEQHVNDIDKFKSAIKNYRQYINDYDDKRDNNTPEKKVIDFLKEEYNNIEKPQTTSTELSHQKETIEHLKKIVTENFDLSPKFIVDIYNNWSFNTYNKIFIEILCNKIYYHLIKSFLNAEYLIKDNYTEVIDREIIQTYFLASEISKPENKLYLQKSLFKTFWQIIDVCKNIKKQLEYTNKEIILIEQDTEQKANAFFMSRVNEFIGKRETILYESFMESLMEVTLIDHIYRSNKKNLRQLFLFLERAATLKNRFRSKQIRPLIELAELKANTLLYGILSQKDKYNVFSDEQEYEFFTAFNRSSLNIFHLKEKSLYNGSVMYSTILKQYVEKNAIDYNNSCDYKENGFNELRIYDNVVANSIKKHNIYVPFFKKLQNLNFINDKYISILEESVRFCKMIEIDIKKGNREISLTEKLNLPFLLKLISQIYSAIDKLFNNLDRLQEKAPNSYYFEEIKKVGRLIKLMQDLLPQLYILINLFENKNIPHSFHPYFKDCFYRKDQHNIISLSNIDDCKNISKNYNYKKYINCFFIESLHIPPLNISYLRKFYNNYQQKNNWVVDRHLKFQYTKYAILLSNIDKRNKEAQQKINQHNKKIEEVERDFKDNQTNTITLLGIFAALLAFITVNIGVIRVVSNIWEYILFSATFALFLSLLVFLIKFEQIENKTKPTRYLISAFAILSLCAGVYFYFAPSSKKLFQRVEEPHINNSIVVKQSSAKPTKQTKKQVQIVKDTILQPTKTFTNKTRK